MPIGSTVKKFARAIAVLISALKKGGYATFEVSVRENGSLLNGKRVLITGGGSGIGLSIATRFVSMGATVLITGRSAQKLDAARSSLGDDRLKTAVWDIADIGTVASCVAHAGTLLGGHIDVLINNAATIDVVDFPNVPEESWDKIYGTNSKGLFFLSQEVCKTWLDDDATLGKKIINISSQGAFVGATYPYRMSKWDVAGFTQGLALKMAPHGVIVNGIAPGIVATAMQPGLQSQDDNAFLPLNPIGRHALPEEIAELALFMASDLSNFIVGQTIVCDGGFSLK
ncbi:MAG: SDR family oxidoreductase [Pseudomonadota bacterium]